MLIIFGALSYSISFVAILLAWNSALPGQAIEQMFVLLGCFSLVLSFHASSSEHFRAFGATAAGLNLLVALFFQLQLSYSSSVPVPPLLNTAVILASGGLLFMNLMPGPKKGSLFYILLYSSKLQGAVLCIFILFVSLLFMRYDLSKRFSDYVAESRGAYALEKSMSAIRMSRKIYSSPMNVEESKVVAEAPEEAPEEAPKEVPEKASAEIKKDYEFVISENEKNRFTRHMKRFSSEVGELLEKGDFEAAEVYVERVLAAIRVLEERVPQFSALTQKERLRFLALRTKVRGHREEPLVIELVSEPRGE